MGKKISWFSAVRKALSPEPKENKDKITRKSKGWFWKQKSEELDSAQAESTRVDPGLPSPSQEVKLMDAENEQSKHAYLVALATAAAAEAAVAAAQAAAEIVRLTAASGSLRAKPKEEIAAMKIQTAFRGYMARKALRALKGLVRLKSLIQGQPAKRQATTTLRCMQTMARVQAEICARRRRMSEENQALQQQLLQKHEKELEKLRTTPKGDGWDDSTGSKEQIEAKLQNRQDAAIRRERALAYAHSHQQTWRSSGRSGRHTFMDPNNPHWGWSWLERWMAARPWDNQNDVGKELSGDHTSVQSNMRQVRAHHNLNLDDRPSPSAKKQAASTPRRVSVSTPRAGTLSSVSAGRVKPASPRKSICSVDDDARSVQSVHSERRRRHSITGSSIRDDESLTTSPAVPSYMAPTKAAKARNRALSLLGEDKGETPERDSVGTVKKRLSFSGSPSGPRRQSGPPKVDTS